MRVTTTLRDLYVTIKLQQQKLVHLLIQGASQMFWGFDCSLSVSLLASFHFMYLDPLSVVQVLHSFDTNTQSKYWSRTSALELPMCWKPTEKPFALWAQQPGRQEKLEYSSTETTRPGKRFPSHRSLPAFLAKIPGSGWPIPRSWNCCEGDNLY